MELGPLEGSYLELLNSSADPLQLYHLYDRMDLTGEEEIELCSGGLPSLGPLSRPSPALCQQWRYHPGQSWPRSSAQHHGQLHLQARLAPGGDLSQAALPLPPSPAAAFPDLSSFIQVSFPPRT